MKQATINNVITLLVLFASARGGVGDDDAELNPTPLRGITASWRLSRDISTGQFLETTVDFDILSSWKRSYRGFQAPLGNRLPNVNDYVGLPMLKEPLQFSFGDGQKSDTILHGIVVAVDSDEDVVTLRTTIRHTYSTKGRYEGEVTACCKDKQLIVNNPGKAWAVRVAVDLTIEGMSRSLSLETLPIVRFYARFADSNVLFTPFAVGQKEAQRINSTIGNVVFSPYAWQVNETLRINRTDSIKQNDIIFEHNETGKEPYPYFFKLNTDGSVGVGELVEFSPGLYDAYVEITTTITDLFIGCSFVIKLSSLPVDNDVAARLSATKPLFTSVPHTWYEGYTDTVRIAVSSSSAGAVVTPFFRFADEVVVTSTENGGTQTFAFGWTPCLRRVIDVIFCVRVIVRNTDPLFNFDDVYSMPYCAYSEVLQDPHPAISVKMIDNTFDHWGSRQQLEAESSISVVPGIRQYFSFRVMDNPWEVCHVSVRTHSLSSETHHSQALELDSLSGCSGNFSFIPHISDGGKETQLCFDVKDDGSTPCRIPEMDSVCFQLKIPKCKVRTSGGETLVTLSRMLSTERNMLWLLNRNITDPYMSFEPGVTLNIGRMYTAKTGDTLTQIAKTFGTTESLLLQKNTDIQNELILDGAMYCVTPTVC